MYLFQSIQLDSSAYYFVAMYSTTGLLCGEWNVM